MGFLRKKIPLFWLISRRNPSVCESRKSPNYKIVAKFLLYTVSSIPSIRKRYNWKFVSFVLKMAAIPQTCAHGCGASIDATGTAHRDNGNQCRNNGNGPHNYQPVQGIFNTIYSHFIQHQQWHQIHMHHAHELDVNRNNPMNRNLNHFVIHQLKVWYYWICYFFHWNHCVYLCFVASMEYLFQRRGQRRSDCSNVGSIMQFINTDFYYFIA